MICKYIKLQSIRKTLLPKIIIRTMDTEKQEMRVCEQEDATSENLTQEQIHNKSQESELNTLANIKIDTKPYSVVKEGKVEIVFPSTSHVFYNPVQEFNRDISIAVLSVFAKDYVHSPIRKRRKERQGDEMVIAEQGKLEVEHLTAGEKYEKGILILEALGASGLRSIRYALEVPGVKEIVVNDISQNAVDSIKRNVEYNKVAHLVTPSHNDAALLMYEHRRPFERFDAVDLDPYGCPSPFLDAAVQSVSDGGLLLVTCTDLAVLAGNAPETCHTKYGSISLKTKACHEMALRILLQCIESHANRYGRYIVPLMSLSADFYIRVFVKVFTSQSTCKQTISKLAYVYQCTGCETITLQHLGKATVVNNQTKVSLNTGPPVGTKCEFCGNSHKIGGPIWSAPLHDLNFLNKLSELVSERREEFGTAKRMQGVVSVMREELPDVPLYYSLDRICSILQMETVGMVKFRSALLSAGYRVSLSHASKTSVKTNAPAHVLWDILRCYEREFAPVNRDKIRSNIAQAILTKEPVTKADFTERDEANPESRKLGLARFPDNPAPFWGPGTRSRAGIQEATKKTKNQNKRQHDSSCSSNEEYSGNQAKHQKCVSADDDKDTEKT